MWPAALIHALIPASAPTALRHQRRPQASRVRLRPLVAGETGPLLEIFAGLSSRSRELRFLAPKVRLTATDLRQLTAVDGHDHVALVAESADGSPVGIARFVRDANDPDSADVAVTVVDAWQKHGVGTRLASALVDRARQLGVRRFTLAMHPDNHAALRLLHKVAGDV
jgi:acetyltransferase